MRSSKAHSIKCLFCCFLVLFSSVPAAAHDYTIIGGITAAIAKGLDGISDWWNNLSIGGDPVAMKTGEYYVSATDLVTSGRATSIAIRRRYTSKCQYNSRFGYGWDMNYNMKVRKLSTSPSRVMLLDGRSSRLEYTYDSGTDTYLAPAGHFDYITENGDGTFTMYPKHGGQLRFDMNGNLTSIADRNGNTVTLEYDAGGVLPIEGPSEYFVGQTRGLIAMEYKLTKIIDDLGREVTFDYYEEGETGPLGLLESVTDSQSRTWTYTYDAVTNDLLTVTGPPIEVDVDGTLTTMSLTTTYAYDDNHNLETVTDSAGQTYLVNAYTDDQVLTQQYGWEQTGDGEFTFAYGEDRNEVPVTDMVTITDRHGYVKEVVLDENGFATEETVFTASPKLRASDPDSYTTYRDYYADNKRLQRVTLPDGKCVEYDYDTKGNLWKVRQKPDVSSPDKIETVYTYESTFNFIDTVTDPMGEITTYEYDCSYNDSGSLVINELMSNNTQTLEDPDETGEYPDWIELYNADMANSVDLSGMYLSDGTVMYQIPASVSIAPGGIVVFYADNETSQGDHHTNFTLNETSGGQVLLYDTDGTTVIDSISFSALATDISYGRVGDAYPTWQEKTRPTAQASNSNGNLLKITYPTVDGGTPEASFAYNSYGQLDTTTSPDGIVTKYEYYTDLVDTDNYGRLKQVIVDHGDASCLNITTVFEYDALGNPYKVTDAETNTVEFTYNDLNLLTNIKSPAPFLYETDMYYNRTKKLARTERTIGGQTQTIQYTYNTLDKLKSIKDPLWTSGIPTDHVTSFGYDNNDNLTTTTDAEGNTTTSFYDERGLLWKVMDAEGTAADPQYYTEYFYTLNGNLDKIVDAKGQETTYAYDDYDRLETITYPANASSVNTTETFEYDLNSRITCSKTRNNDRSYFEYDALGRLRSRVNDGDSRAVTVDNGAASGNWTTSTADDDYGTDYLTTTLTDSHTFQTPSALDGKYRVFMWWPSGATATDAAVEIDYSSAGSDSFTVDQTLTAGRWNDLGIYDFDSTGSFIAQVTVTGQGGGLVTCADAVRFVPITEYTYDIASRLTSVNDGGDITQFDTTTDRLGRVKKVTDQDGYNVGYDYDKLSRTTNVYYPDDQTMDAGSTKNSYVDYDYDALGRVENVYYHDDSGTTTIATYQYDELSRPEIITYDNGTKITYGMEDDPPGTVTGGFDLANRLLNITNVFNGGTEISFDYAYDDVGNRTQVVSENETHDYDYDNIYQLKQDNINSGTDIYDFEYDELGNRDYINLDSTLYQDCSSENAARTEDNELNQYGSVDFTGSGSWTDLDYDDNGNLLNDASYTYSYDYANRLVSADDGSPAASYTYDYMGRRLTKTVGTLTTRYVYSGAQVVAEYENSTLARKYIYGPGIDEPVCMIDVDGQTETRYYYHRDGLGSVVALSNTNGDIVEAYSYDAFGKPTIYTDAGADGLWRTGDDTTAAESAVGNPYMFTGRRYDPETGHYYYRARMYNTELGRFMQPDPVGYYDSANLYQYCLNNPVNRIDPLGLCSDGGGGIPFVPPWLEPILGGALGGMASGALAGAIAGLLTAGPAGIVPGMMAGASYGALSGALSAAAGNILSNAMGNGNLSFGQGFMSGLIAGVPAGAVSGVVAAGGSALTAAAVGGGTGAAAGATSGGIASGGDYRAIAMGAVIGSTGALGGYFSTSIDPITASAIGVAADFGGNLSAAAANNISQPRQQGE